jgi:taurine--2-oxoglutarate transaminase
MIENAAVVGKHLGQRLEEIKTRHPSVGDVRYIGLFSVIELVKNRTTREPMPPAVMGQVGNYLKEHGLSTFIMSKDIGAMVFVVPPLCITAGQVDEGLEIVEQALKISDAACQ